MKRYMAMLLILVMLLSVSGCTSTESSTKESKVTETVVEDVTTENETMGDETKVKEIKEYPYKIVTTGQSNSYDNEGFQLKPLEGEEYYGQDAVYDSWDFSFTDNGDGTVTDNNTGLIWQQIPVSELMSWEESVDYCENLELAGYDDWRIPTAKELFGLSDFSEGWPYLDNTYFEFPELVATAGPGDGSPQGASTDSAASESAVQQGPPQQGGGQNGEDSQSSPTGEAPQGGPPTGAAPQGGPPSDDQTQGAEPSGDASQGGAPQGGAPQGTDRPAEASETTLATTEEMPPASDEGVEGISKQEGQFWSANFYYAGTTHGGQDTAFGVNHATGHIKGYPSDVPSEMGKFVRAVRGSEVAVNDFVDNEDGTVTDDATGLMWMQDDNGQGIEWDDALEYAENFEYAGYDDWRLPDIKELQSIVDYTGSYPAIDQAYFNVTELDENENYYFWSSTSAYFSTTVPDYGYAWYVAFGKAIGGDGEDSHGAGAVRFSPKYSESSFTGEGGDNILNSVRLVRNISN